MIPDIGLGTYRLKGQDVIDSVTTALELGYRHIDTAQVYTAMKPKSGVPSLTVVWRVKRFF